MKIFLAELCAFPAAPHDDWVDCFTQAINYLRQGVTPQAAIDLFDSGWFGGQSGRPRAASDRAEAELWKRIQLQRRGDPSFICVRCKRPIEEDSYIDGGHQKWHAYDCLARLNQGTTDQR